MDKRPIGVFDSGMGGLTCVKEVMKVMPGEDVIYFGDTGRLPYGSRGADTIVAGTEFFKNSAALLEAARGAARNL